jgi:VWFA-related protein
LTAIHELTAYAKTLPGRKIIVWISPGWPLLSGVRQDLDNKQQAQIFRDIVGFSNEMRDARLTLYNINPRGVGESLLRANYYQEFVKGVRKPSQTQVGNLGLQVLAVQSGGLALESSNDIASSLSKCIGETEFWYEVTLAMPPAEQPNEYHHLEIKVDKPGLATRTRNGYYAQPEPRQ